MAYQPSNINGQATMANSEPVVIASNQSAFPITINSGTKTIQTELAIIQTLSANTNKISDILDVSAMKAATIFIDHGRDATTAFVGSGTEYRVETSEKDTGNDTWRVLYSVVCDITVAVAIVMDGSEAAGDTVIDTGTGLPAVGDNVFFKNATIGNSEWAKVVARVTTASSETFTILNGLTNTQAAITLFNKAEHFVINIELKSIRRLRVVANNNAGTTNVAIVWRCAIITN